MQLCSASIVVLTILLPMASTAFAAPIESPRLEIGPQITQTYLPVNPVGSVQYQLSVGGVGSIRLRNWIAMDSGFGITPTTPIEATTLAGGRLTEGFLGTQFGHRVGRVEIYGKIRPGIASFGEAILHAGSGSSSLQFEMGRLTEPALDLGGIVMIRISKRLAVRYDAGDTLIHYRRRFIELNKPPFPSLFANSFKVGAAFLFSF
jgi:hypothetical protein